MPTWLTRMPEASKNDLMPCGSTWPPQASQFTVPAAAAGRGDPAAVAAASAPPVIAAVRRNSRRFIAVLMRVVSSSRLGRSMTARRSGFPCPWQYPGVLFVPPQVDQLPFLERIRRPALRAVEPVGERFVPIGQADEAVRDEAKIGDLGDPTGERGGRCGGRPRGPRDTTWAPQHRRATAPPEGPSPRG